MDEPYESFGNLCDFRWDVDGNLRQQDGTEECCRVRRRKGRTKGNGRRFVADRCHIVGGRFEIALCPSVSSCRASLEA